MLDQQFANMANLAFISVDQCFVESKNRNKNGKKSMLPWQQCPFLVVESSFSYTNFHIFGLIPQYTEKLERFSVQLARTSNLAVHDYRYVQD